MNVGFYGDSTQNGISRYGGVSYLNEYPPSKVVQMMLDNKYGSGVHSVSNYGVAGSTIIQALDTPLFDGKNIVQHMQSKADDIIIANWGINDAFVVGNSPTAHKSYYSSLKGAVEAQSKAFIYEAPNPLNGNHDPILSGIDAAVKTIAGIQCADIYGQIKQYYPQWAAHLSDDVHPNSIMYLWVGTVLFKSVDLHI